MTIRDIFSQTLSEQEQQTIDGDMHSNAVGDLDFYMLILLSSGIAFYGLLQNSAAVVIGAMLVAPLMSPMMAIGFGIVKGKLSLVWQALTSTLLGMLVAIASAALSTMVLPIQTVTNEILARASPNILDLFIATIAGFAGAYALCRTDVAESLPGVAISASLVPPLCVVGFGVGYDNMRIASNALLLFSTNLAGIVVASIIVFWMMGFRPISNQNLRYFRRTTYLSLLLMVLVAVPLTSYTIQQVREVRRVNSVTRILEEEINPSVATVEDIVVETISEGFIVGMTVYIYDATLAEDVEAQRMVIEGMRDQLETAVDGVVTVRAQVIPASLNIFERPTLRLRDVEPLRVPTGE